MGLFKHMFLVLAVLLFIPSQIFWLWQVRKLGLRLIRHAPLRRWVGRVGIVVYAGLLALNLLWPRSTPDPAHLTLRAALVQAPFSWWMLASLLGFLGIAILHIGAFLCRTVYRGIRKILPSAESGNHHLLSPERRHFLTRAAVAVSATPFAACAYGLVIERREIQTTHPHIYLQGLPKAFDGFRIAQLSDIHIGPFMPAEDIRRCVAMVNAMKPEMVALTGDFVTWEGSPEGAVVEALSGLKAPFGVYCSLGNHEIWAKVEDSITRLFTERGFRVLRRQSTPIETSGERFNLIGVDYESRSRFGPTIEGKVREYLQGVEPLMLPGAVNILLSHNPNTFDRAAELGIDLSLAGHTHGGQVSLEYISPNVSPARLMTAYVRGWFKKGNSQLYVNRGIGTIFSPIRFGAPPEITVYELKRAV